MAVLQRDGVDIYYEVHGSGPAVLLTHGYSATSQMWQSQIEALGAAHTLVLWDMRGHGRSDSPENPDAYSETATVADMAALLDAVGVGTAIVGGLSLGGYMSLAFHLAHPERVRALLIIDTGPGYKRDEPRDAWNRRALERADDIERRGKAAVAGSPEQAQAVHNDLNGLARAARGMLTQRSRRVIDSLPDIQVPAIVIAGANDEPFLAATDYMATKIPRATKHIIADAGHAVNIDQPAAFNATITAFLAKHDL